MAQRIINNFVNFGTDESDMHILGMGYSQNLYPEIIVDDSPKSTAKYYLRSILGMEKFIEFEQSYCRGIYVASSIDRLVAIFGTEVFVVEKDVDNGNFNKVKVGEVAAGTDRISITESGGDDPWILLADGYTLHAFKIKGILSILGNTYQNLELPRNNNEELIQPSYVTYEYGFLTINDKNTNYFYRSEQYPLESGENNEINMRPFTYDHERLEEAPYGFYINADYETDNIAAMISVNSYLFVMGKKSVQMYTYSGDNNLPFNTTTANASKIGILSSNTLSSINDMIFWLGANTEGQFGIFTATQCSNITRISNNNMERIISKMKNPEDSFGFTWTENGHAFYAITFNSDDLTFVYDMNTGIWHNRVSTDPNKNEDHKWRYSYSVLFDNKLIFGTDNNLVIQKTDKFTEHDGNRIIRLRRGGCTIDGYSPFIIDNISFIVNNGYCDTLNPTIQPKLMFRYSGNGSTFGNERIGYMGRQGQYNYYTEFPRLGIGRIWNFELSCSENIDFCIINVKILANTIGRF